jgi:hypothetical protein
MQSLMFATPFICHTPPACSFSQQAFFIPKLQPPRWNIKFPVGWQITQQGSDDSL